MDGYASPDVKNQTIHSAYLAVCTYASDVRFRLSSKSKVSISKFNLFKRSFDYLFILTGNRKEFKTNTELVKDVKAWLLDKRTKPDIDFMMNGIELFDRYQVTMIDKGLISDS